MSSRVNISLTEMSRRLPDEPTRSNDCDNIERQMAKDEHRTWGWIIYRSDYTSEENWQEFLLRFRVRIEKALGCFGGLDMLSSLDYHIFEDPAAFSGVDAATIRSHFRIWAATAADREQGAGPARSQRYQFCIQVDSDALQSILHAPASLSFRQNMGWVKLIWKDWEPAEDDVMEWPEDQPIEGIALQDVGWCRATYEHLFPTMYALIRNQNDWHREYRRPPKVIH